MIRAGMVIRSGEVTTLRADGAGEGLRAGTSNEYVLSVPWKDFSRHYEEEFWSHRSRVGHVDGREHQRSIDLYFL